MGLLDNQTDQSYYQGDNLGSYQFVSLEDIINQFMIVYVGEEKIISKAKRTDVAFHAQRALAELSFDTFKSEKSQEIVLPPSLTMMLPHDYVNYTRILWSDDSGIKHPIYPTKHTQNPFKVRQETDGSYNFSPNEQMIVNGDFSTDLALSWKTTNPTTSKAWDDIRVSGAGKYYFEYILDKIEISVNQELSFSSLWSGSGTGTFGRAYGAWQKIDARNLNYVDLKAVGESADRIMDSTTVLCNYGVLRIGISSVDPEVVAANEGGSAFTHTNHTHTSLPAVHFHSDNLDLGFVEWNDGTSSEKTLTDVDVRSYDDIWIWIQSNAPWQAEAVTAVTQGAQGGTTVILPNSSTNNTHSTNNIDQITLTSAEVPFNIRESNDDGSTTWNNYKAHSPSENDINDYQDDKYWPVDGNRYGLEPQHAQVNGSYFIDQRLGKIHFSSNISGKTVILDYISDSLGTDEEMRVHKFAEEAMYKWIIYAILSTRINTPEYIIQRFKKERFAAVRNAKLRLSNFKLEELTQILRGKSKWIKH